MKFLNYKDKETVVKAAKTKRQVLYKNHSVRFYADMAAGVHKKQIESDCREVKNPKEDMNKRPTHTEIHSTRGGKSTHSLLQSK